MSTYKFKTTLKCSGCVAAVQPSLDAMDSIDSWEVDLDSEIKILTVETDQKISEEITKTFKDKGYEAILIGDE